MKVTFSLVGKLFFQFNKLTEINSHIRKDLYKLGKELRKHYFESCRSPLLIFMFGFSTSNGGSFKICLTSKKYMFGALFEVLFHQCLKILHQASLSVTISFIQLYSKIQVEEPMYRCSNFTLGGFLNRYSIDLIVTRKVFSL